MTPYDVAMIGLVAGGMIWGAIRGITWQLASIASLVLGYMFAHPLSAQLAPHFPGDPVVARALAMLAVYVAVSGGVYLAAWAVRESLRKMRFEAYDRHLGMLLGGLEGCLLGVVITLFVVSFAPQTRNPIFQSPSGRVVGWVMDSAGPVLPGEVRDVLVKHWSGNPDVAAQGTPGAIEAPAGNDARSGSTVVRDLIEMESSRIGRTVADAVQDELEGGGNDQPVKRR
jgi:membrane protein required for colicin V production